MTYVRLFNENVFEDVLSLYDNIENFEMLPIAIFKNRNKDLLKFALSIVQDKIKALPCNDKNRVYRDYVFEMIKKTISDKTKQLEIQPKIDQEEFDSETDKFFYNLV